jgi:hypothetical protein
MKHLLTGVAVVAALAFGAPIWAQPVSPSGGNPMGMPGPNPGGPGLTPYSGGAPGPKPSGSNYIPSSRPPAAMAPGAMAPATGAPMSESTSATPPSHRHARHMAHAKPSHHPSRFPNLQGNVANQLNQAELSRLQSGNTAMPPAPPPPGAMPPPQPMGTSGGGAPYRP